MKHAIFAGLLAALPAGLGAHPHIFIEAGVRLVVDDAGVANQVEVIWKYDPLYSLLVLEDMGLDQDRDGVLTDTDKAALNGFDMKWIPDFEGDLYISSNGAPVALGRPQPVSTDLVDGQIVTRHIRDFSAPADQLELRVYDPGFYTAYELTEGAEVAPGGQDCSAAITPADLDAAISALEEILFTMPDDQVELAYPEVGRKFSDLVTISCNG